MQHADRESPEVHEKLRDSSTALRTCVSALASFLGPLRIPLGVNEVESLRTEWRKEIQSYPRKHSLEPPLPEIYDDGKVITWYETERGRYVADRDMVPESSGVWAVMRAHHFAPVALGWTEHLHELATFMKKHPRCDNYWDSVVADVQQAFVILAENIQEGLHALEGHEAAIPTPAGQTTAFDGGFDRTAIGRALNWADDFLCMVYCCFRFSKPESRHLMPATAREYWDVWTPSYHFGDPPSGPPLAARWTPKVVAEGCSEWAIKRIAAIPFPSDARFLELRSKMDGDLAAAERQYRAKSRRAAVQNSVHGARKGAQGGAGKKRKSKSGTGGRPAGSIKRNLLIRREAMKKKLDQLMSGPEPQSRKAAKNQVANEYRLLDARDRPDPKKLDKELKALRAQKDRQNRARK